MTRLAGRVVVTGDADVARAVADDGATVLLVGEDADGLGRIASDVQERGGRAVMLVGDLTDDHTRAALAELLAELFPAST